MKLLHTLTLCVCLLSLISCGTPAHVSVTTPDGSIVNVSSSARFGGHGAVLAQAGGAKVIVQDDYDASFREGSKTARVGLAIWGASSIANTVSDAQVATNASNNAAAVSKTQAVEATKQAQIAADAAAAQAAAAEAAAATVIP